MSNTTETRGKCLAQARPTVNTAISLYSPGSGVTTEIQTIIVVNQSDSSVDFSIFHDDDGTTYSEVTALFWEQALAADTTREINLTLWMNNSAGNLATTSATASAFTFTVYGIEHKSGVKPTFLQGPSGLDSGQ